MKHVITLSYRNPVDCPLCSEGVRLDISERLEEASFHLEAVHGLTRTAVKSFNFVDEKGVQSTARSAQFGDPNAEEDEEVGWWTAAGLDDD